jgi:hypothetical protein
MSSLDEELMRLRAAYESALQQYRVEVRRSLALLSNLGQGDDDIQTLIEQRTREADAFERFRQARRSYLARLHS